MKRILWISAITVTLFALSLNASAQPGQGGQQRGAQMGGQASPQQLLRNAEVVRMLALTEEQTTALAAAMSARGQGPQAGGGQGGAAAMTPEAQRQRTTEVWTGINQVLNATQQARFKEIYFQANNGLNAPMLDDWLLAVVDLTPAQKEQIAKLAADRSAEFRAAGGVGGGQQLSQEQRQARQTANQRFADQIKAVLTAEQKAKAEQLTAGAAALRTTLGLPTAGQGGQQPGQGAGRGGAAGGGFVPGSNTQNWQPGQAPVGGGRGQGGERQGGPRGGGN